MNKKTILGVSTGCFWMRRRRRSADCLNGKESVIRFSKFTLSNDMVGSTVYGRMSFAQYIKDCFKG